MGRVERERDSLYGRLLRHALIRLVFIYYVPLLLIALFFHLQYRRVVRDTQQRHLVSLAEHQASTLDMFLGDRLVDLVGLSDEPEGWLDPEPRVVAERLARLRQASEAFIDLTVLDGRGRVLGYAGPHPYLQQQLYADEDWFRRLTAEPATHVITDIYAGFRDEPHFTMAIALETGSGPRVLRAVLGPEKIRAHMASLEGAGEVHAFVVGTSGEVQFSSAAAGSTAAAPVPAPGAERSGAGLREAGGGGTMYAWARLGSVPWTLVAVDATGGQGGLVGGAGPSARWVTSLWLFAVVFFAVGGGIILLLARWVAREQYAALQKERELSHQLQHAAKLASVGELAAGIAHEINNPLAVVAEKAGLLQDLLDPRFGRQPGADVLREHLAAVEQAVYRCTGITRNLLGFVRDEKVQLAENDLHALLDDVAGGLLGPELEVAGIRVERSYDSRIGAVVTDPGRLRQVVFNLLKNARDAIGSDGCIRLTTRLRGDRFTLEVADTGCGLDAAQLERVFMPFFTTKSPDRGTGLGLSVSYRIVKGLGGSMTARSRPNEGATFTVELPLRS